jgi:hypothetical protein
MAGPRRRTRKSRTTGDVRRPPVPLVDTEVFVNPAPLVGPSPVEIEAVGAEPGTHRVGRELDYDRRALLADLPGSHDPVREQTLGKVRVWAHQPDGTPVGGLQLRVKGRRGQESATEWATVTTDQFGYAAVELSYVDATGLSELTLVPLLSIAGGALDILRQHVDHRRDLGTPHEYVVDTAVIADLLNANAVLNPPTIDFPDAADLRNSPRSFDQSIAVEGDDCTLSIARNYATRQFLFRQVVRERAPALQMNFVALARGIPQDVSRNEMGQALLFDDDEGYVAFGAHAVLGKLNTYQQAWMPMGHSLGELLYSLALAPCEETRVAIIEWSRQEEASRSETAEQSEQLQHSLLRDRSISEAVDSVLDEVQSGSSSTASGAIGISFPGFSLGGGGGGSESNSEGHREIQASTLHRLADAVVQRASSLRSQRSTVVTQSRQAERDEVRTRVVRNHNVNHALTIEYFEVLKHFRVRTQLLEQADILLVPYEVPVKIWGDLPTFAALSNDPKAPFFVWLDRHASIIRSMVPASFGPHFEALRRFLHCGDVYGRGLPKVTASNWTLELQNAWRRSIHLRVVTTAGEAVALVPVAPSQPGAARFVSPPVDITKISRLLLSFNAQQEIEDTLKSLTSFGLDAAALARVLDKRFVVRSLLLTAHTNPSHALPSPSNHVLFASEDEVTLGSDEDSMSLRVSAPNIDYGDQLTARQQDYCLMKELAAFVREDMMRYVRAVWMNEDPDRRALRFDRVLVGGKPLLDVIQNQPVGLVGNMVAFPLVLNGQRKKKTASVGQVAERFISMPTRGVFAETLLSRCNATELRDVTRRIDPETACNDSAPDITGVSPGSRRAATVLTPSAVPPSLVSIQNAPAAPDPSALENALRTLATPDVFRNMSLGAETVSSVQALALKALESATATRLAALANAAAKEGGGSSGSAESSEGADETGSGSPSGALSRLATAAATESLRSSNPARVYDHAQVIAAAQDQGLMSEEVGERALQNLFGAQLNDDEGGGGGAAGSGTKTSSPSRAASAIWLVAAHNDLSPSEVSAELLWCRYAEKSNPGRVWRTNGTKFLPRSEKRGQSQPAALLSRLAPVITGLTNQEPEDGHGVLAILCHGIPDPTMSVTPPAGAQKPYFALLHSRHPLLGVTFNPFEMADDPQWDDRLFPFNWPARSQNVHYQAVAGALRSLTNVQEIHLYGCQLGPANLNPIIDFVEDIGGKEVWLYSDFTRIENKVRNLSIVNKDTLVVKKGCFESFDTGFHEVELFATRGVMPGWQIRARKKGAETVVDVYDPDTHHVEHYRRGQWPPAAPPPKTPVSPL